MKKRSWVLSVIALLMCSIGWTENYKPGESQYAFDPSTLKTIKGDVLAVIKTPHPTGRSPGIHVKVVTVDGPFDVHVGPQWYLEEIGLTLKTNQLIEVVGSLVVIDGQKAIIATEITKDKKKYSLRDTQGIPYWSGRGHG
jgi:hypothetical protein